MTHLIQILKRDLPSQFDISYIDLCQFAYIRHGLYLDPLEDQGKLYETADKVILVLNDKEDKQG